MVGLDEDYSKHQKDTKVENRNYYVECKTESSESAATVANNQETTSEVSRKLKTFGAKHCMNWYRVFHHNNYYCSVPCNQGVCILTPGNDTRCTFEFTVRDEIGSLAAVLEGFASVTCI